MTTGNDKIRLGGWVNKRDRILEKRSRKKSDTKIGFDFCSAVLPSKKGLDVNLVNAHHAKTVPGRKSDVLDCHLTGVTIMAIIIAIVAGEKNPHKLAALKDRCIHSSTEQIAQALTGDYRAEHLFVLQQELTLYDIYQQQIAATDREEVQ
jgi:hypothetical protein